MRIMVNEGVCFGKRWRNYNVVTDNRVAIVEMTEAILGWNIGKVTIQGDAEWLGYSEESIVAFKLENGRARLVSDSEIGDFMPRLLAAAGF